VKSTGSHPSRWQTMCPLPCRNIAGPREPLLLEPHSQSVAFESPSRPSRAPDTNSGGYRPSRVIRGLRPTSHVAIGTDPMTPTSYARPPGRHSFRVLHRSAAHDFGEPNVEAFPYPRALGFRSLAASLVGLTGKLLRAFRGWALHRRVLIHAIAEPVRPGIVGCPTTTPHASRVTRTCLRKKPGPRPTHRICGPQTAHLLCATPASIENSQSRFVRVALIRTLRITNCHRIERRDCSGCGSLAYNASATNGITSTSLRRDGQARLRASASTGPALAEWWVQPLSFDG